MTLTVGALSSDIEISAENNTLAGIRDAINSAVDNPGVDATIVNADSGSYLRHRIATTEICDEALKVLFERLPDLELDDPLHPEWKNTITLRGVTRLPAHW